MEAGVKMESINLYAIAYLAMEENAVSWIWMNVDQILVNTVEHALTSSMRIPANVFLVSQESIVKLILMTVQ